MLLETCSLRAAALLCGKRKCISNSEQFLFSRLQLANLQAAWIMHRHLAMSRRPLLAATTDGHPSLETGNRRNNVWRLNNGGGEHAKLLLCSRTASPSAAQSRPTCLINRSPLEARGAASLRSDTLNELHCIMFSATLQLMRFCDSKVQTACVWNCTHKGRNMHTCYFCQIYEAACVPFFYFINLSHCGTGRPHAQASFPLPQFTINRCRNIHKHLFGCQYSTTH